MRMVIKFRNAEERDATDLTRIGIVAGGSGDGLSFAVEPQIDGWESVPPEVVIDLVGSGMRAAGVFATIEIE